MAPCRRRQTWMKSAKRIWQRYLNNNRMALITCWGYSLGGTLAQGIAARLRARGEQVAFLGLLDTRPPETQNWQEKRS